MSDKQIDHHKKSKLEQFQLGFEYNRTFTEERSHTKQRAHHS